MPGSDEAPTGALDTSALDIIWCGVPRSRALELVIMVWPHGFAHRWWSKFQKRDDSLLSLLESLAPTEDKTVSSTQREGSGSTEDLNLQQLSSLESFVDCSRFSVEMSVVVSLEQQRKEELAAMAPPLNAQSHP